VSVGSKTARLLPPETEERLREFTELLATAIANAESHEELDAPSADSRAKYAATGGTISLRSPHGAGTSLQVELPLDTRNQ
jgi:hypothetical protein